MVGDLYSALSKLTLREVVMSKKRSVNTVSKISQRLNVAPHRVQYVLRSRGITPQQKAGNVRIFSDRAVSRIADELRQIDQERTGTVE